MSAKCYEYLLSGNKSDIIITKNDKEALSLKDSLLYAGFTPFVLPDFRAKKGDDLRSYSAELYSLLSSLNGYFSHKSSKKILISPVRTILNPLPSSKILTSKSFNFGDKVKLNELKEEFHRWGYNFVDVVESSGEVSFRGDIFDIYCINLENPIRVSLFDDEIESIRYFEPSTQKSDKSELESFEVIPALFALDTLSYENINKKVQFAQSDAFVKDMLSLGFWELGELSCDYLSTYKAVVYEKLDSEMDEIALFDESIDKQKILSLPRMAEPTKYKDIVVSDPKSFLEFHPNKKLKLLARNEALVKQAGLTCSFIQSPLIVNIMSEDEIVLSLNKPFSKKRRARTSMILDELKIGDYVVHENYGIGIFKGLVNTTVLGATRDFVSIVYQGYDKLLLPVENLHVIDRYISDGGSLAVLDRLGKGSFQKLKAKTKEKLFEIASEIVKLAAQRELTKGFRIDCDSFEIASFQASSGFEYTQDQQNSIEQIFEDLGSSKVMDRLISGDVGFGKTEVAMNALFATIKSGFQALLIVPTTLLCAQHFKSIKQRFEPFGLRVAHLDRFVSTKEKNATLKALKEGEVDVCVGTHSLLGVELKNLALVVIDEEHKFGVKQKEALKNMRTDAHILSMSATPIPRSLNMALSSIRGYSQILTPPKEREDVRTFVKEFDENLIKEVISREVRRGGQIFYVHNRIASIEQKAKELKRLLPNLRVLILHSEINATETEKMMLEFEDKKFDLLLCTSIIESGIHLPNVNTILIDSADRFGIADLHQLRGRVGRGSRQGYCYFFVEDKSVLSENAKKRLIALESNSFLGSGSVLAYHDLEIRGGGNLVGEAQSGHIKNIGYSLYLKMLEDSINSLMNHKKDEKKEIDLKLAISAFISVDCVSEDRVRLELYRRLSQCQKVSDVYEIEEEMCDRFGRLDTPTKQFLELIIVKILAYERSIKSISSYGQNITILKEDDTKTNLTSPSKDDDDMLKTLLSHLKK